MNMRPFVDPRTGVISFPRDPKGIPMGPASVRMLRTRRGFGDVPGSNGAAGPLIPAYNEYDIFNPPGGSAGSGPTSSPQTGDATGTATGTGLGLSTPFGQADRRWNNPTTFATVPINAATRVDVPVLSQNFQRNALIIQNGSLATVAGDVAPTLYVNFNAQPQIGSALALPPGVGIAWDVITPRDSIFIAFGPFTNAGNSVVIQGAVIGGTYIP